MVVKEDSNWKVYRRSKNVLPPLEGSKQSSPISSASLPAQAISGASTQLPRFSRNDSFQFFIGVRKSSVYLTMMLSISLIELALDIGVVCAFVRIAVGLSHRVFRLSSSLEGSAVVFVFIGDAFPLE